MQLSAAIPVATRKVRFVRKPAIQRDEKLIFSEQLCQMTALSPKLLGSAVRANDGNAQKADITVLYGGTFESST